MLRKISDLLTTSKDRTDLFVKSYREVLRLLGCDPYRDIKRKLNEYALHYAEKLLKEQIGISKVLEIMGWANSIDVSMPDYEYDFDSFTLSGDLGTVQPPSDVLSMIESAGTVVVALDNAGEAIVDIALSRKLMQMSKEVVIIARDHCYEVDVTRAEAEHYAHKLGIQCSILGTGDDYPVFYSGNPEVAETLDSCDVILAKGIANLEAFLSCGKWKLRDKVILIFKVKCKPLASLLGTRIGNVLVLSGKELLRRYTQRKVDRGVKQGVTDSDYG